MTTNHNGHIDIAAVKSAARGRWRELLTAFGFNSADLDGRHHPCPRCNGTDRFRAFDDVDETGGVICNQCHNEKNADGLSSLAWKNDWDFPTSLKAVAGHLGVNGGERKPTDIVAEMARIKRMPLASFIAFGAHVAQRGKLTVARVPMFDELRKECGYFDLASIDAKWLKGMNAKKPLKAGLFVATWPKPGDLVLVPEGLKDAAALHGLDYLAVGLPTCKMAKQFARVFAGCHVVIVPDRDLTGQDSAPITAARLAGVAASVRIATLPGDLKATDGDGVREVLAMKDGEALLRQAIKDAKTWEPTTDGEAGSEDGGDEEKKPRKSQADRLVELAHESKIELFHTPGGDAEAYASIPFGDHCETMRIASKAFRTFLSRQLWTATAKAPAAASLQDSLNVLAGQALFDGDEHPVAVRLAEHDGAIYLDLADAEWSAVRIDADGWQVVKNSPVRFVRPRGVLALPSPERGGHIDELREFVNVGSDDDFTLLKAVMLAYLRPKGPYPVLAVYGEQGSAKSTATRVIRDTIDPNTAPLRSEPKEPRDLMIAAANGWIVTLENLSAIPIWLSDSLCRLATGGGFSTRELFSDGEEKLFDAQRPVILNGITEVVTRPDLADRAIAVTLPTIPEERRRPEAEFWVRYRLARPRILGGLLDAVSVGLKNLPTTHLTRLPRMADFAIFATAAEPALGVKSGAFINAYAGNRDSLNSTALEACSVAPYLTMLIEKSPGVWEGTASELLTALNGLATDDTKREKGWPAKGQLLAGILRRLAPNLRQTGIHIEFERTKRNRRITISTRECRENSVTSVTSVTDCHFERQNAGNAADSDQHAERHPSVTQASPSVTHQSGASARNIENSVTERHPSVTRQSAASPRNTENSEEIAKGDADDAGDAEIPSFSGWENNTEEF